MEDQLQQSYKMEAIGTLAGGIAHDFNNILGIILGNAELSILDLPDWSPARHNLEKVRTACIRAKEVIQQLLSFTRKTHKEKKPIKIGLIIKEFVKLLRSSIPANIEIRQNIKAMRDNILGDPAQIHQILINLCSNAAHAMQSNGGLLEISLINYSVDDRTEIKYPQLSNGEYVQLSIIDTGQGIDSEIKTKIFDPYFTTKAPGEGTGMGLTVVLGIVKDHNGEIILESETGKGTSFHLFFPVIDKRVDDAVSHHQNPDELPTGQETVLFVDDEEHIVEIGKQMLEFLGYHVIASNDPLEALDIFKMDPQLFDLVISDMTMPKMTGDQLATQILAIRSDIPIIISTGYNKQISERTLKRIGVKALTMKPYLMEKLAKIVRDVLETPPAGSQQ